MATAQQLTPSIVLETAASIVQAHGLESLTIRHLARALDAYPASIYHHIGDLHQLREAVCDEIVAGFHIPPVPIDHGAWHQWIAEFAQGARHVLRQHAGVFTFVARHGPTNPNQLRVIDATMQVLVGAGLSHRTAAYTYGSIIYYVGNFAEREAQLDLENVDRDTMRAAFEKRAHDQGALLPGVAMAAPHFAAWDPDEAFRFGLDPILDWIATATKANTQ